MYRAEIACAALVRGSLISIVPGTRRSAIVLVVLAATMNFAGCSERETNADSDTLSIIDRMILEGRLADAQRLIRNSLDDETDRGTDRRRADLMNRLAEALWRHDDPLAADGVARAAIALAMRTGDVAAEARAYWNLGTAQAIQGKHDDAVASLDKAIERATTADDRVTLSWAYRRRGLVHQERGFLAAALADMQLAAALAATARDRQGEAKAIGNIGLLYASLGQPGRALTTLEQSLAMRIEIKDSRGEAKDLTSIALVEVMLNRPDRAVSHLTSALELRRRVADVRGEANTRSIMAQVELQSGRPALAQTQLRLALELRESIADRAGLALDWVTLGQILERKAEIPQSLEAYTRALTAADELGMPDLRWRASYGLFRVIGEPGLRVAYGKLAVNAIQTLRARSKYLVPDLQESLLTNRRHVYEDLAALLMDLARLPEAEQVMAFLKEDEHHDFVRGDTPALGQQLVLSSAESALMNRYSSISGSLARLGHEYGELSALPASRRDAAQQQRYRVLQDELAIARNEYRQRLAEIRDEFKQMNPERAIEFGQKDLDSLRSVQALLQRIDSGAMLIHYLVTPREVHILLTTPEVQIHRSSTVSSEELNRDILAFRNALQNPASDPLPPAKILYQHLIAPIRTDLEQSGSRHLLVSLDGNLRYIPVAALHNGTRWLIEDFTVSIFTSASRDNLGGPSASPLRVAALGVSEGGADFLPLPSVPDELSSVVSSITAARRDRESGVIALDRSFGPQRFSEILEAGYPVIHVASHFRYGNGSDADAFLLLGGGARLTLADLRSGPYPMDQVDLLTLSACETALVGRDADGREIEGLGVVAQRMGARSVIASLWSVADRSTADLMSVFYSGRGRGLGKAVALRNAQLVLLAGPPSASPRKITQRGVQLKVSPTHADSARPRFAHPYYWAPFILIGGWI